MIINTFLITITLLYFFVSVILFAVKIKKIKNFLKNDATKINFCNTYKVRAVRRVGLEHSD